MKKKTKQPKKCEKLSPVYFQIHCIALFITFITEMLQSWLAEDWYE